MTFLLLAIGPFSASFIAASIALGIVAMLREGRGDPDRRSFTSSLCSDLGLVGIALIPLAALASLAFWFREALASGHIPTIAGSLAGILAALIALGRAALGR